MSTVIVRDFRAADAPQLNDVALAAFLQFKDQYSDWPAMANGVSKMSELAESGEIIVAEDHAHIVGGVVYVPAGKPKAAYFDQSWPIIRMLVVVPHGRGRGIGRRLTEECIGRARRDGTADCSSHHYDNDSGAAYVHQNGLRTASQLSTNLWCTLRYLHQVTLTSASGQQRT